MGSVVALLELEGQLVDDLETDGEGVRALNADGDGIVVTVAEAGTEMTLGGDGPLMPQQDDISDGGKKQQQREPPPCRIERGVGIADACKESDGEQQEVEAAAQEHLLWWRVKGGGLFRDFHFVKQAKSHLLRRVALHLSLGGEHEAMLQHGRHHSFHVIRCQVVAAL